jgi:mono/diheme cytochrome c family protein
MKLIDFSRLTVMAVGLVIAAAFAPARAAAPNDAHFADADNRAAVILGKRLYAEHCAGCHGRNLQGQPLWQLADAYAGKRAPAFDETGEMWRRADEEIFRTVKFGGFAAGLVTAMPAFGQTLGDDQILAVVAFIKARWPLGLRILQAMHNPGFTGMPGNAAETAWQLPPNCNAILRGGRAVATSRTNAVPQSRN